MNEPADDTRDASLRVAKRYRDSLKAYAAIHSRPLYDVTNEAIENYLESQGFGSLTKAISRSRGASASTLKKVAGPRSGKRS